MWRGSHVGKKEKLWTSVSLKLLRGKKLKLGTCQVLTMGNKCDMTMTSSVKWYPGQNSTRRTLHSISMKTCEVHLGKYFNTENIMRTSSVTWFGSHFALKKKEKKYSSPEQFYRSK